MSSGGTRRPLGSEQTTQAGDERQGPVPALERVERMLAPFVRDAALWPVTLAALAHLGLGLALVLSAVLRSPDVGGSAVLVVLATLGLLAIVRDLRRGGLHTFGLLTLATLALTALASWIVLRTGVF